MNNGAVTVKSFASRALRLTPVSVISMSLVPSPSVSISRSLVVLLKRAEEFLLVRKDWV